MCKGVWCTGIPSKKIPPWGKLLQFSWVKLLHCNCHILLISYIILAWNATELFFSSHFTRTYTMSMHFTRQRSFNGFFHKSGEINVFRPYQIFLILPLTHKRINNTQTNTMAHTHTHNPTDTFKPCIPCLVGPNCRESTVRYIGVTTYPRWCNNLPRPKLLQFFSLLIT